MEPEIDQRIRNFLEGSELQRKELLSSGIPLWDMLLAYDRALTRPQVNTDFVKEGNTLVAFTYAVINNADKLAEDIRKFVTQLQKSLHLSSNSSVDSRSQNTKRVNLKKRSDKESDSDVFDNLGLVESVIMGKRFSMRGMKQDDNQNKTTTPIRSPSINISYSANYALRHLLDTDLEVTANKKDLKSWGYCCDRGLPKPHMCYPCTHTTTITTDDSGYEDNVEPTSGVDEMEESFTENTDQPSISVQSTEVDREEDEFSIRSGTEQGDVTDLLVCELGQIDDGSESITQPGIFFDFLRRCGHIVTSALRRKGVYEIINENVRQTGWPLCSEHASRYEEKIRRVQQISEDTANKPDMTIDGIKTLFQPLREYAQSDVEFHDWMYQILKFSIGLNVDANGLYITTGDTVPPDGPLEKVEEDSSSDTHSGFGVKVDKPTNNDVPSEQEPVVEEMREPSEERLISCPVDGDGADTDVGADADVGADGDVDADADADDEGITNREVLEWHKYLIPFIEEVIKRNKKDFEVDAYKEKVMDAFPSNNGKNTLSLWLLLRSNVINDAPMVFITLLHMANDKLVAINDGPVKERTVTLLYRRRFNNPNREDESGADIR